MAEKTPDGITETVFDTQTLAAGTYIVHLQSNGRSVSKKFVVMH